MGFFQWDEAYDTGVGAMNEEHKALIGFMNELYDQNAAGDKAKITDAFQKLLDYTVKHFTDEENYMVSIKFPGLDNHKKLHENLLRDLKQHFEKFNSSQTKLEEPFFGFLKLWLVAHMRGIDIKYGVYAKQMA